ncbi:UNVERIFIED_CONTAM: hypothetical protein FKN15_001843 [Acipenser sinensis]
MDVPINLKMNFKGKKESFLVSDSERTTWNYVEAMDSVLNDQPKESVASSSRNDCLPPGAPEQSANVKESRYVRIRRVMVIKELLEILSKICPFRPVQRASGYAVRPDQLMDGRKTSTENLKR